MIQPTSIAFKTPAAFRAWLKKNQLAATELVIRLYKVHAADRGITYKQALDEALCFGWIDGVRRSFDTDSFTVRFTPRKSHSIWSRVNVARLVQAGRMKPSGLAAFAAREEHRTGVGMEILRDASPVVPAHEHLLGDEREKRADTRQASRDADRRLLSLRETPAADT